MNTSFQETLANAVVSQLFAPVVTPIYGQGGGIINTVDGPSLLGQVITRAINSEPILKLVQGIVGELIAKPEIEEKIIDGVIEALKAKVNDEYLKSTTDTNYLNRDSNFTLLIDRLLIKKAEAIAGQLVDQDEFVKNKVKELTESANFELRIRIDAEVKR